MSYNEISVFRWSVRIFNKTISRRVVNHLQQPPQNGQNVVDEEKHWPTILMDWEWGVIPKIFEAKLWQQMC